MIEIVERTDRTTGKPEYVLLRNGAFVTTSPSGVTYCSFTNPEDFRKIETATCSDFDETVWDIDLRWRFKNPALLSSILINIGGHISYFLTGTGDPLRHWKKPYSFSEYAAELAKQCKSLDRADLEFAIYASDEEDSCEFKFCIERSTRLCDELSRTIRVVKSVCNKAEEALFSSADGNSLTTVFDFPEEVRVACEQYLLYFIQFLRDIGVEAASRMSHDAGRVLFTVVPRDKKHGLENVRRALDLYISLPSAHLDAGHGSDSSIQRLVANVYHLKSQLSLSQAILQAQEATINQQRLMLQNVLQQSRTTASEPEEILGGLVSITRYEAKGITINLPEFYRQLKKLFKGKD